MCEIFLSIFSWFLTAVVSVRSSVALSDGFDDTKTWDDHDALDVSDVVDDVMPALNTSTPDAKKDGSAHAPNRKLAIVSSTPPTSTLVTKLFPQLKVNKGVLCYSADIKTQLLWSPKIYHFLERK